MCCLLIGWCSSDDVFPDVIRQEAFDKIISNYYLNDPFSRHGRDYVHPTAPYQSAGRSRGPQYATNGRQRAPSRRRPSYSGRAAAKKQPSYSGNEELELDYLPPRRRPASYGSAQSRKPAPSYSPPKQKYKSRAPRPGPVKYESHPDLELDYLPPGPRSPPKKSESYSDLELDYLPPGPRAPPNKSESYSDLELDYLPPPSRRTRQPLSKRKRNSRVHHEPWSPNFCSFFDDGPSGGRVKRRRPKYVDNFNNQYRGHPSDWPDLFYGDLGRYGTF